MMRDMLCCTTETAVGGREGRRCQTAAAVMFGYARAAMLAYGQVCSE